MPDDDEHVAIRDLRRQMAFIEDSENDDHSQQNRRSGDRHLGEAETITIIQRRMLNAVFVTEDRKLQPLADGVRCIDTWSLVSLGLKLGILDRERVRTMRLVLLEHRRISPRHRQEIFDPHSFEVWLTKHSRG